MKYLYIFLALIGMTLSTSAQVSNLQLRISGDVWKLGYTTSSAQINCGLCPQLIDQVPEAQGIIDGLQDSLMVRNYRRAGVNISISGSIIWPALKAEIQLGPSMRRLNTEAEAVGRYVNRNVSAFIGLNPLQFDEFLGKYYLGQDQQAFLDLSDAGIYAQFSYDGGFEQFVRSTNNIALLARWQPTVWLSDQKKVGLALRGGARMWMLGNNNPEGPFVGPNGLPKKVKPAPDWFIGLGIKVRPF